MICVRNHECIFGKIIQYPVGRNRLGQATAPTPPSRIELTKIGQIIDKHWNDIPNQYDNIQLDKYVIMPNHIHGIIKTRVTARITPIGLGMIIGPFKSKTSVEYLQYINKNNLNISGQIRQRFFHYHIIRNKRSLNAIRNYIVNNPENWEQDIDNLINL